MISKEEVQHIAKLARLGLSAKEIEEYRKDLSSILGYVEKIKEADVSEVQATSHSLELENVTRKDEPEEHQRKLIAGFLKVKSVFK